jgi:2-hydroxy-6-oxonona-2,4-dienedioate hydrolase
MSTNLNDDQIHAATVAALSNQARQIETPCGDGNMVWRIWGDGPPLVCFHGAHGSWTHWFNNIPGLAKHFTVMVPDLPGMGDSAMPPEPYTFADISKVVSDCIDQVIPKPQSFDVAGFSFGSTIAGFIAHYQGDRVKNLALISSGGMGLTRTEPTGLRNWRKAETEEERVAANRHNLGVLMFGDHGNIDDLAVYLQKTNTSQTRFKSRVIKERWSILVDILPKVSARFIGVWGEVDIYSKGHIHEREAYLKNIQKDTAFLMIPGAGHWVNYEHADTVNSFLIESINRA